MQPYLARLGVKPEVQQFFEPYFFTDGNGNLCFPYGPENEIYGLGFHRIPAAESFWLAGSTNKNAVRMLIICSSAMEAISWLDCNFADLTETANLLFAATGNNLATGQITRLKKLFPCQRHGLLFANELLGNIWDLKVAATLCGYRVNISFSGEFLNINFRNRPFQIPCDAFSLSKFERLCGYRFKVKTLKPKKDVSWLSRLETQSFIK